MSKSGAIDFILSQAKERGAYMSERTAWEIKKIINNSKDTNEAMAELNKIDELRLHLTNDDWRKAKSMM
jgi:dsDNA-specific endonuclease/ATPase MutS2